MKADSGGAAVGSDLELVACYLGLVLIGMPVRALSPATSIWASDSHAEQLCGDPLQALGQGGR